MDSENETAAEELTDLMESDAASAGDRLRAAREAQRLDLSHVAAETRIPIRHLEAIEAGDYGSLPSRTYAIGFARNYARAVDLDAEEIVSAVREELADGHARESAISGGMEPGDPGKLPSAGLAWFGGFAAIALAVGIIAFYSTYFGAGAGPGSLITDADEAAGSDGEALAGAGAAADGDGEASTAAAPPATGQVIFTATGEGAWVRFYEEGGERLFEGVMQDGDTYEVPTDAADPRLNTGRPNLFRITIGGQAVSPLADEMVPVSDAPVSAEALLARVDNASGSQAANN